MRTLQSQELLSLGYALWDLATLSAAAEDYWCWRRGIDYAVFAALVSFHFTFVG
jgi:hypothetical protein